MTDSFSVDATVPDFVAVVPAGGVGSRLWPLSTPAKPKFLLDLAGVGTTLIQDTLSRLEPIASSVLVVTGARYQDLVAEQLPQLSSAQIVGEPSPRDSMAAIALAAALIEQREGPRVMGSFAADQIIADPEVFRSAVATAIEAARAGKVVTIGLTPTEPSSAFGYIKAGAPLDGVPGARTVEAFTEKPDPETAATFISEGNYLWNAGMFVVSTDVLLGHLARLQPTLHAGVRDIAAAYDTDERAEVMERVWPTLTKIAIDHAIAEPVAAEGGVATVPASFTWHDVGDFDTLAELVSRGDDVTSVGRTAPVFTAQSQRTVVVGGDKPIAIVGLDDVVVVDTPEATLIVARTHAQAVKDVAQS